MEFTNTGKRGAGKRGVSRVQPDVCVPPLCVCADVDGELGDERDDSQQQQQRMTAEGETARGQVRPAASIHCAGHRSMVGWPCALMCQVSLEEDGHDKVAEERQIDSAAEPWCICDTQT